MCLLARSILRQMSENRSSPVINRAVLSLVFATNQSPPKRARVVYGRSSRARPFPPTPEWQALGYFGPTDSKFRRQVSYPFLVAIPSTDLQL
jgi:hypothetical protein